MKIKTSCKACGGAGFKTRELRIGDIVTPIDGSSMPHGLHRKLEIRGGNEYGENHVTGFFPVRVLSIEGEMLAVEPVYFPESWKNDDAYKNSIAPIWGPGSCNQLGDGFWIHSRHVIVEDGVKDIVEHDFVFRQEDIPELVELLKKALDV